MNIRDTARRRAAALRPMLEDEGLTYSQAAARLGITRGAVAGLVDRHGITTASIFSSPTKEGINPMKTKPKRKPVTAFVPLPVQDEPEAFTPKPGAWDALPKSTPVPLDARTGCAWPIGDNPTLFCNEPVQDGKSWCAHHYAIGARPVVVGSPVRRETKPKVLKGLTS